MGVRRPPSLETVIKQALKGVVLRPEDAAAARLATRYGAAIDEASDIAAALCVVDAQLPADDVDARKQLAALAAKVETHQVLVDLGPKLLAVLAALGMTPAARTAAVKGGAPNGAVSPGRAALDRARARAGARANGAPAVDPPAT